MNYQNLIKIILAHPALPPPQSHPKLSEFGSNDGRK